MTALAPAPPFEALDPGFADVTGPVPRLVRVVETDAHAALGDYDGITVDTDGRVYASAAQGVQVLQARGLPARGV